MGSVGYLAYTLSQPERDRPLNLHSTLTIKRGDEILEGPYPKRFTDFVGQDMAIEQILAAITSAIERQVPMEHLLLASGSPGVGKTALSRLTAHLLGVGFVEIGGSVKDVDAIKVLKQMADGDVLFIDEIHRLVFGGKARAEWLLTLLQDGSVQSPQGSFQAPDVTVIAASTDAQKLPQTVLDRFMLKPVLESYTRKEAVQIARLHAAKDFNGGPLPMPESDEWLSEVCAAANNNPRRIGMLLGSVRDSAISAMKEGRDPLIETGYDISTALRWNGLTRDGLTMEMQEYLTVLFLNDGKAGVATIKATLNESEINHTEKELIQRGYVVVTPGGRLLTERGLARAEDVASDLVDAHAAREEA